MAEQNLEAELDLLERKLKILLQQLSLLKEENANLKKENQELKLNIKTKDSQLNNFQNKIKISKIVDTIDDGKGEVSEMRKAIDDYIKEIDKCILHLSK